MRSSRPFRFVALRIMLIVASFALPLNASIIFDDGGIHDLDSFVGSFIDVKNSFWDEPTTINLRQGFSCSYFHAYDDSLINLYDGRIITHFIGHDNSILSLHGGQVDNTLYAKGYSRIFIDGGTYQHLSLSENAEIQIIAGHIDTLGASGTSKLYINGGALGYVTINENVTAEIESGLFAGVFVVSAYSNVSISGGVFETILEIHVPSAVTIYGTDFVLDQHSVYGEVFNPLDVLNHGHLTGYYLDGQALDIHLQMYPGASVICIPEPCSLSLLFLAILFASRSWRPYNLITNKHTTHERNSHA